MNSYTIEYAPNVHSEIARLPRNIQARVDWAILSLADNPRRPGSIKLAGPENLYRIRVGDYRIIYAIRDAHRIVIIVVVGHRREIYRGL